MSRACLLALEQARSFEATRRFEDLALFHVDFDDLIGEQSTESTLSRMAGHGGRVALIGPSGSGKSSVMAAVLGPFATVLPNGVVPLRIPVAVEADETVTQAGPFARHVISVVTRWANPERFTAAERDTLERAAAERRRRSEPRRSRRFSLMTPGWVADAGFAAEVRSAGEDIESHVSSADAVAGLARLIALFRSHDLEPFFVIDDSDSWLQLPEVDRTALATGFLTEVTRMLATELDCGFCVAVHNEYLVLDAYRRTESLLSTTIEIPRFEDAGTALGRILSHRIRLSGLESKLTDAIDPDAVGALEVHYHSGANYSLRDVLKVADRALQHACSEDLTSINRRLVLQAIADWV
jgi:Fe-S cluster assembly ATPase SufC